MIKILIFILGFPITSFAQCPNITFDKNGGAQGQYQITFDLTDLGWSNCNGSQINIVYNYAVSDCLDEKWQSLPSSESCGVGSKQKLYYTGCRNSYCANTNGNLIEVISFTIEQSNPYKSETCTYLIDYANSSTDSKDSDYCKYYLEVGLGFETFNFNLFYGFVKDNMTYLFVNSGGDNMNKTIYVEKSENGLSFSKIGQFIITKDEQYYVDIYSKGNCYYRLKYISSDGTIYSEVYYVRNDNSTLSMVNSIVTDGKLRFSNNLSIDYDIELFIFDEISRTQYVIDSTVKSDIRLIEFDISHLKSGMYIVQYKYLGLIFNEKIVVKK